MKCKKLEEFIIENMANKKAISENQQVQEHLLKCKSCARFMQKYFRIQDSIRNVSETVPSDEIVQKTLNLYHTEIEKSSQMIELSKIKSFNIELILFISLIIFTAAWIFSLLFGTVDPLHLLQNKIMVFTILLQNGLMLLFLPILLKRVPKFRIRVRF
jgi:hypothetical protein